MLGKERSGPVLDVALVGGLTALLVPVFLRPIAKGYPFPVGPDLPVYLWWARAGAAEGLSIVGARPGAAALILTVASSLGIGIVPAVGGLQYALGPAIGLAAAAVIRGRGAGPRAIWFLAGLLAGAWAVFLAAGYVANLAFAAPYVAAAAALERRTRRGTIAAAILLGGGGLAHPQFFVVGAIILGVTAGWSSLLDHRFGWATDGGRTFAALVGGSAAVGIGLLAMLVGPGRLGGETSKDGFMRATGQWATLRETYLDRFGRNRGRYAGLVSLPLALLGAASERGYVQRFLVAWASFTVVALPIGLATGWFPPDRMLTFAFCIPMLAALGIARLGRTLGRWWLAWPAGAALVVLMIVPALRSWDKQITYMSPDELRDATLAGRIASTTPPGTPLVFVVEDPQTSAVFLAAHALNVARAAVPPDRVDDVHIYLGTTTNFLAGRPTLEGDPLHDLASDRSLADIPPDRAPAVFVVREFARDPIAFNDPHLERWDPGLASTVGDPRPLGALPQELQPSSPDEIRTATIRTLLLLLVLGLGWAWWATGDLAQAAAIAPAFGVASLTIAAIAFERFGVALDSSAGATFVAALAGGSGYALVLARRLREGHDGPRGGLVLERQTEIDPPPEVAHGPDRQQQKDRRHDPATDEEVHLEGSGEP